MQRVEQVSWGNDWLRTTSVGKQPKAEEDSMQTVFVVGQYLVSLSRTIANYDKHVGNCTRVIEKPLGKAKNSGDDKMTVMLRPHLTLSAKS